MAGGWNWTSFKAPSTHSVILWFIPCLSTWSCVEGISPGLVLCWNVKGKPHAPALRQQTHNQGKPQYAHLSPSHCLHKHLTSQMRAQGRGIHVGKHVLRFLWSLDHGWQTGFLSLLPTRSSPWRRQMFVPWCFRCGVLHVTTRNVFIQKHRSSNRSLSAFRSPRDTQRESVTATNNISYRNVSLRQSNTSNSPCWVILLLSARDTERRAEIAHERQGREEWERTEMKTQQWHRGLCFHLVANFKTKPKDEILSGESNIKPPPVGFLCFEVTKYSLECHGMHATAGPSLLQGAFHSSSTQNHFFSGTIKPFYWNKAMFTLHCSSFQETVSNSFTEWR